MRLRSIIGWFGKQLQSPSSEIRILMYHRVNPSIDLQDQRIAVTPEAFEEQMDWLVSHGWEGVSLQEAITQLRSHDISRNKKQVVITFDDGFLDNYEYAFPVLKKYRMPATIFLTSCKVDKNPDFLKKENVQEMFQHQVSFGAHTIHHHKLPTLISIEAWKEIYGSKTLLESRLEIPMDTFAYPYGHYNKEHRQMAIDAGFKAALSVVPGGNSPHQDLFTLKRTEIAFNDSLFDFVNKVQGGFDWFHRWVQVRQGRLNELLLASQTM